MGMTSQDDAFRDKRDEVLRVYYDSPETEHILCLDEKTGMQALPVHVVAQRKGAAL